ncbi:MAG: AAA family ATPase [Rhodoferax sp.]|uniref:AAA family ATPase n=1 Tax=Rhodoferax sp. TaxID=50421 RepID=UPI0017A745D7|nr:AAA family ATPase [Rhodoferax sp.]NMM14162.1 AAA family ATPase [Rhodoferax sp.]
MSDGPDLLRSPWISQFQGVMDFDTIRARTFIGATYLPSLATLSPEQACKQLNDAFERIYIAGPQHCEILQRHFERARGFAMARYVNGASYLAGAYECLLVVGDESFWCLTGLAGNGKSQLMAALERLLPAVRTNALSPSHPSVRIKTIMRLKINAQTSDVDALRDLANPAFLVGRKQLSRMDLQQHLAQWLFLQGVVTLVIDELQFLTQSATANTRVVQLLMLLGYLGLPVTYTCNYSLGHKLLARPQEERQRLLNQPIILQPETNSRHWISLVDEYAKVNPDLIALDGKRDGAELGRLTGGISRLLRLLVVEAFRVACRGGVKRLVRLEEIVIAYKSVAFSVQRADVEAMASLAVSSLLRRQRRDLVCPFGSSDTRLALSSVTDAPVLGTREPTAAVRAMVESTLTPGARATLKDLRQATHDAHVAQRPKATVTKLPMKKKITTDALYAGAKVLRDMTSKVKKPGPTADGRKDD